MADLNAWPHLDHTQQNEANRRSLSTTLYRSGPASERHRSRASSDVPLPSTPQKVRHRGNSLDQSFLDGSHPPSPGSSGKTRVLDRKSVDTTNEQDSHPLDQQNMPKNTPPSPPLFGNFSNSFPHSHMLPNRSGSRNRAGSGSGGMLRNRAGSGSGGGSGGGDSTQMSDHVQTQNLSPPPRMLRQSPSELRRRRRKRRPTTSSSLSASWSGETIMSGLIHGPHFIPHIFDSDDDDDDDEYEYESIFDSSLHLRPTTPTGTGPSTGRRRGESLGNTWPPIDEGRAWWDSMKRVGVLSVLELERHIGLSPASLVFRSSNSSSNWNQSVLDMVNENESDQLSNSDGDEMMSDGDIRLRRNVSFEGSVELQELPDRRILSNANTTNQTSTMNTTTTTTTSSTTTTTTTSVRTTDTTTIDQSETILQSTTEDHPIIHNIGDRSGARGGGGGTGEEGQGGGVMPQVVDEDLSADDIHLFENIYNAHPFAGAAFLRAFIACSFSLLLFHIHTFLSWPVNDDFLGPSSLSMDSALESFTRKWLFLQVAVLTLQIPLRMEVQRALFRVSTARDTADATNRFRTILASSVWKTNRNFGRISFFLEICGLGLLLYKGMFFPSFMNGTNVDGDGDQEKTFTELETQIISINASNFLVFLMRGALLVSLLYFVQVSIPARSQRRGLSEGTIKRLRRITYQSSSAEDSLTQCAVCLEGYEDGDFLMVLPCDIRHNFHSMCIEPWLQRMNTCPLCQRGVPDESING